MVEPSLPGAFSLRVTIEKAVPVPIAPAQLRSVLVRAASLPEVADRLPREPNLTIKITGDRELRRLNRDYLGHDAATDVLSFPAGEDSLQAGYLGDLAISWPAVVRQSANYAHPPDVELGLLAIHGFLHLLGWDHADFRGAADMERVTGTALRASAIEIAPARLTLGFDGDADG
ncbi:MAG TPA: rRNA maturation RNase YbeY [Candidatus Dormibacteraeota bacterium]|jgi:probable rRNA maturation factor|nr:rRNA maturation RNase YbeY [Candidatus Dormibacteraeota bacterium]